MRCWTAGSASAANACCPAGHRCTICDYLYDPEIGDPDNGVEPGTAWEDLPDDWVCPDCGVGKADFEMVEI